VLVLGVGGDGVEDMPPTPGQLDGLAALERDFGEDHGLPLGIPQLDFVEGDLGTSACRALANETVVRAVRIRLSTRS
jgi:hypothetical protein